MIINWLLYSVLVASILAAAGYAFEYAVRSLRLPTRWIWISVMLLSTACSAVTLFKRVAPLGKASAAPAYAYDQPGGQPVWSGPIEQLPLTIIETVFGNVGRLTASVGVDELAWVSLDNPVLATCGVCALIGLVALCVTVARLSGVAYALNHAVVEEVPVLLSRNIGPALIGVFRFRVVLPYWATEMSSADLRTILKHEQQHALAGDPTLTLTGLFILALQPWNPALWVALSRLRLAIESDCDARVLGADGDVRRYGELLVSVYERAQSGLAPLTAFVARTSQLEARIRRMVDDAPKTFSPKTVTALTMAFALGAMAFSIEVTAQKTSERTNVRALKQQPVQPKLAKIISVLDSTIAIKTQDLARRQKGRAQVDSTRRRVKPRSTMEIARTNKARFGTPDSPP